MGDRHVFHPQSLDQGGVAKPRRLRARQCSEAASPPIPQTTRGPSAGSVAQGPPHDGLKAPSGTSGDIILQTPGGTKGADLDRVLKRHHDLAGPIERVIKVVRLDDVEAPQVLL